MSDDGVQEWVCEYCGDQGRTTQQPIDSVPCPTCGEPVVPVQ